MKFNGEADQCGNSCQGDIPFIPVKFDAELTVAIFENFAPRSDRPRIRASHGFREGETRDFFSGSKSR